MREKIKDLLQHIRWFFEDYFVDFIIGLLVCLFAYVFFRGVVWFSTPTKAEQIDYPSGDGLVSIQFLKNDIWSPVGGSHFHLDACDESIRFTADGNAIDHSDINMRIRLFYDYAFEPYTEYSIWHYYEMALDTWYLGGTSVRANYYGIDAEGHLHLLSENVSVLPDEDWVEFRYTFKSGAYGYSGFVAEFEMNAHYAFGGFVEDVMQGYFMWGELECDGVPYVPSAEDVNKEQLQLTSNIFENIKILVGYVFDLPNKFSNSLQTLSDNISGFFENLKTEILSVCSNIISRIGGIKDSIVNLPKNIGEEFGLLFQDLVIKIWQESPFGNYQEGNSSISPEIDDALNNGLDNLPNIDEYIDMDESGFGSVFDAFYSVGLFVGLMEIVAVIALVGLALYK